MNTQQHNTPILPVRSIDAAQLIIARWSDGETISIDTIHQLLFLIECEVQKTYGVALFVDGFIARSGPKARALHEILGNYAYDDDAPTIDNTTYIGGSFANINNTTAAIIQDMATHFADTPDWRIAEICTNNPFYARTQYGDVIELPLHAAQ